ncbi:hypothetical protein OH77DRAFT_1424043 [Trametes cingulata]|nr:hypothetical protein OH77DRAFT_1424043 [Trametes cingulata]
MASPASTFSEPDSPTVRTPPLESSTDGPVPCALADDPRIPFSRWIVANDGGGGTEMYDFSTSPGTAFDFVARPVAKTYRKDATATDGLGLGVESLHTGAQGSVTPVVLHAIVEEEEEEDEDEDEDEPEDRAPCKIIASCREFDPAPFFEFALKGPAIVVPSVPSELEELNATTNYDWLTSYHLNGRLLDAFAPSSFDDDEDTSSDDERTYHLDLHDVNAERQVRVRSALRLIGSAFTTVIEWCDDAASASSDSSSEDLELKDGEFESGSSFLSSSGSSFTEEGLDLEGSLLKEDEASTSPALDRLRDVCSL